MNLNPLAAFFKGKVIDSVSIPIRDLMNLNPHFYTRPRRLINVSIPIRDLMNLNLSRS